MNKSSIEDAIRAAAEFAELAPEAYKESAFHAILSALLNTVDVSVKAASKSAMDSSKTQRLGKAPDAALGIVDLDYDWSDTTVMKLDGIARILKVIDVTRQNLGIDGLTPKEISQILMEKFRISKTEDAIRMSLLSQVGKYVDRKKALAIATGSQRVG